MDEKRICTECGTENEQGFEYCKNCGAALHGEEHLKSEIASEQKKEPVYENSMPEDNTFGEAFDNIDGIKSEEIALFIGKKANRFLDKFQSMQASGSKLSFCWPVAVLSLLFGPFGAAFWFFYRKMYKKAFLFSLIGAVITIGIVILEGDIGVYKNLFDKPITDVNAALNDIIKAQSTWRYELATNINRIVHLLSAILLGMFSVNMYKNFVVKKIKEYRSKNADPRYYRLALSVIGGTNSGMVWVGILLLIATNVLADVISGLINVI